jgi:hypothetical protein
MTSMGEMLGGTVFWPVEYGKGPEKPGNMVTGFPFVRTLKVPVLAPEPPPIAAGLMKVMVDDVKESDPSIDTVPVMGVAWAIVAVPKAKADSTARRFSIWVSKGKKISAMRRISSH